MTSRIGFLFAIACFFVAILPQTALGYSSSDYTKAAKEYKEDAPLASKFLACIGSGKTRCGSKKNAHGNCENLAAMSAAEVTTCKKLVNSAKGGGRPTYRRQPRRSGTTRTRPPRSRKTVRRGGKVQKKEVSLYVCWNGIRHLEPGLCPTYSPKKICEDQGGRWNTKVKRCEYCADAVATALAKQEARHRKERAKQDRDHKAEVTNLNLRHNTELKRAWCWWWLILILLILILLAVLYGNWKGGKGRKELLLKLKTMGGFTEEELTAIAQAVDKQIIIPTPSPTNLKPVLQGLDLISSKLDNQPPTTTYVKPVEMLAASATPPPVPTKRQPVGPPPPPSVRQSTPQNPLAGEDTGVVHQAVELGVASAQAEGTEYEVQNDDLMGESNDFFAGLDLGQEAPRSHTKVEFVPAGEQPENGDVKSVSGDHLAHPPAKPGPKFPPKNPKE